MSKHTETGMGKGNGPHSDKRTYPAEALAQMVVERVTTGKLPKTAASRPVTEDDRALLARIAGESVEVFNDRMATELRHIAHLAASRIKEKLETNQFKPSELGFIYAVAHDKRLSLDGSRALQNASVNIQVNNYGSTPKETLLADLDGLTNVTPPPPSQNPTSSPETPKEAPPHNQPTTDV